MNQKIAKKTIDQRREEGKSDQQIYNELSEHYPNKKNLALLITGTATGQDKVRYRLYNNILIGLLTITLLLRLWSSFLLVRAGEFPGFLILIAAIMPALFIYGISQYLAPMYKLCGILSVLGIITILATLGSGALTGEGSLNKLVDLVLVVPIAILSFYLAGKMFPKFNPGKLQSDGKDGFILS